MTPSKTVQTELKAITAVASGAQSISSVLDVATIFQITIFIDFGLDSATTPVGTEFRVQTSQKTSGDDTWRNIPGCIVVTGVTAPSVVATDGTEAVGQTVIECGATVPALEDLMFFKNGTI